VTDEIEMNRVVTCKRERIRNNNDLGNHSAVTDKFYEKYQNFLNTITHQEQTIPYFGWIWMVPVYQYQKK